MAMENEEKLLKGLQDTRADVRLQTADQLMKFFQEHDPQELQELERFIAGLSQWANCSNYKVVLSAMDVLELLSQKMRSKFKHYIVGVMPALKERLGDAKETVRDRVQLLIQHLMQPAISSPQFMLDRLMPHVLGHKNWRVREQGLLCLSKTLDSVGSTAVSVGKFVGAICKLLGDANSQVRACSIETLVDIYRNVGAKVRGDLQRRGLPEARLASIMERFDEVDTSGKCQSSSVASASDISKNVTIVSKASTNRLADTGRSGVVVGSASNDEVTSTVSRDNRSRNVDAPKPLSSSTSRISTQRVAGSGALVKEDFEKLFLDTPTVTDIQSEVARLEAGLSDPKTDWSSHLIMLRQVRGVIGSCKEPLDGFLKNLENPLCTLVKDLRSQVLRETCVTISYLSLSLRRRFDHAAEVVLPVLLIVLQSSAKVMSSSCDLCIRYILENTHAPRLIPVMTSGMVSKATSTRSSCAEYCNIIVHTWEPVILEKQLQVLSDTIRTGIADANNTARQFMRRAFWGLHQHFPTVTDRLEQSLDSTQQHYLQEERKNMAAAPPSRVWQVPTGHGIASSSRTSRLKSFTASESDILSAVEREAPVVQSGGRLPSGSGAVRVEVSSPPSGLNKMSKLSRSVEALDRSPSPVGGRLVTPLKNPSKIPSPKTARTKALSKKDYTQYGSLPRPRSRLKQASLTKETMLTVYGSTSRGQGDDMSETGSVTSERSAFSITSEFSALSPYVKYPSPVTDLGELLALCSSSQWSERRDGIAQLQLLLESSRELSSADIKKIKAICNRLFFEPHTKVYSSFLDVLTLFVEQKTQLLDDWLFVLLLRLIHKQGGDNLSSVGQKLTMVLDMVRSTFAPHHQFLIMCRILTDPSQPMNNKVKLAWLEYFSLLVPLMESSEFANTSDVRPALAALLKMTSEPKSMEIRKYSKKAVVALFDLNAASMSLMLRQQPQPLQDAADRILKGYLQTMSSDEGESPSHSRSSSPSPFKYTPHPSTGSRVGLKTATPPRDRSSGGVAIASGRKSDETPARSKTPTTPILRKSPSLSNLARPTTPSSRQRISSTPTATPTRSLRGPQGSNLRPPATPTSSLGKKLSSSIPDMRSVGVARPSASQGPRGSASMSRTLSGQAITIRRSSSRSSLGNHPIPKKVPVMPRSQSVEPSRQALSQQPQEQLYSPTNYQNGNGDGNPSLFTFLPNLNFGSPESEEPYDHISTVLKQLHTAEDDLAKIAILRTLLGISRERSEMCNWEENFHPVLLKLIELLEGKQELLQLLSLRVLREMVKSNPVSLKNYTEMTIVKVLTASCDPNVEVSRMAEAVFQPMAAVVEPRPSLDLLGPMLLGEPYPLQLSVIKLLEKVVPYCGKELLLGKLKELCQGLVKAFSHSESVVRKASVFCMVALHSIVGEELKPHLSKLSMSQMKLLELYIKKQELNGHL